MVMQKFQHIFVIKASLEMMVGRGHTVVKKNRNTHYS